MHPTYCVVILGDDFTGFEIHATTCPAAHGSEPFAWDATDFTDLMRQSYGYAGNGDDEQLHAMRESIRTMPCTQLPS